MELKNCMEILVLQFLDEVLAGHSGICTCEECRYDIAALALNFLPPRYVATSKGEIYSKASSLGQQFQVDIVTAISHAITIVNPKPHHENREVK